MSFWYFSQAELLQQSMNFTQNQFFHSSFISLLLWEAVIIFSKLPEMGNAGLSSNGDLQVLCWDSETLPGQGQARSICTQHGKSSLSGNLCVLFYEKKPPKLSCVGPQHWGTDRSFPNTWRHKKEGTVCCPKMRPTMKTFKQQYFP